MGYINVSRCLFRLPMLPASMFQRRFVPHVEFDPNNNNNNNNSSSSNYVAAAAAAGAGATQSQETNRFWAPFSVRNHSHISPASRASTCELEIDVFAADVMNIGSISLEFYKHFLIIFYIICVDNKLHSQDAVSSQKELVPQLKTLWNDERQRRKALS